MSTDAEIADPFRIGWRTVRTVGSDGRETFRDVPLTEEDFLHPQEEDHFMLSDPHWLTVVYLRYAIEAAWRGVAGVRVFAEHRIDWQVPGIKPHGPDVVAFADFFADLDPNTRTVSVGSVGARPLAVLEVTSEATRAKDFEEKFLEYFAAGVPVYVIVDLAGREGGERILAFRRGRKGFVPIPGEGEQGVFVPGIELWLRWEDGDVVVADKEGRDIPTPDAERERADAERERADAERQRAEVERKLAANERKRADDAEQRAEAEKQRAEALAAELADLRAKLSGDGN